RDRRMVGRLAVFDCRISTAEKHELLTRGLRPAWPPSGSRHPGWRSHVSDCRLISVRTFSRVLVLKWVAPIQALRVPNGCSTVARRTRMLFGARSSRSCMASITASCSQRLILRSLPVVHWVFSGHSAHLLVQ